jgi:hypothetical protein
MNTVKVKREDLLAKVRANRASHRELFLKAQANYRKFIIEELDRMLADAKANRKIRRSIDLVEPRDHTSDYDRTIMMLWHRVGPAGSYRREMAACTSRSVGKCDLFHIDTGCSSLLPPVVSFSTEHPTLFLLARRAASDSSATPSTLSCIFPRAEQQPVIFLLGETQSLLRTGVFARAERVHRMACNHVGGVIQEPFLNNCRHKE